MDELIRFVAQNGYIVIFLGVLIEQIGIPIPSNLLLIVSGALVGLGQLDFALSIIVAVIAALIGNTVWFWIGRSRGFQVLGFLCKISLEPDSCVSKAKETFLKNGERSLVFAKFIPGLSTFAQPLAGATGMSLSRFLVFDALGSVLWAGVFIGLGYVFSDQFMLAAEYAVSFGSWFGAFLIFGLALYLGWKFVKRQRFLKSLRVARIDPVELNNRLETGEDIVIIDLRDELDFKGNPYIIPSAIRMAPDELEHRHEELRGDLEVILYCT